MTKDQRCAARCNYANYKDCSAAARFWALPFIIPCGPDNWRTNWQCRHFFDYHVNQRGWRTAAYNYVITQRDIEYALDEKLPPISGFADPDIPRFGAGPVLEQPLLQLSAGWFSQVAPIAMTRAHPAIPTFHQPSPTKCNRCWLCCSSYGKV